MSPHFSTALLNFSTSHLFGYYMLGLVVSQLYFESKTGSTSHSIWWQHASSAGLAVQFWRVVGARQEGSWICVRNGREKSLRDSDVNPSLGELLWLFILGSVHVRNRTKWRTDSRRDRAQLDAQPPLHSSPVPRFLRTGRGTGRRQVDGEKQTNKVLLRDAWGFALIRWCLGSCMRSLMQLAVRGDLSSVGLDVVYLCLWVAAVWMMERRQALLPLLLVFTLGASTYGKF